MLGQLPPLQMGAVWKLKWRNITIAAAAAAAETIDCYMNNCPRCRGEREEGGEY